MNEACHAPRSCARDVFRAGLVRRAWFYDKSKTSPLDTTRSLPRAPKPGPGTYGTDYTHLATTVHDLCASANCRARISQHRNRTDFEAFGATAVVGLGARLQALQNL